MADRLANTSVNYQELAREFHVGDQVYPYPSDLSLVGQVNAVYPAIGMVDVQVPAGSVRVPVEEITRAKGNAPLPPEMDSIPGGAGTVPVSGGPSVEKVARRFVEASLKRNALYWAEADRKYRATQNERGEECYYCPKCKDVCLKPAVYRREGGASMRLLACPTCLFLIERDAVIGHHLNGEAA